MAAPRPDPVAVPMFIGLKLAMARREKLGMAGRWLPECDNPNCDHQYCGRKLVSFDWSNKRREGTPNSLPRTRSGGGCIMHMPIVGSTTIRSTPYNPKLLTVVARESMLYDDLPDKLQILSVEIVKPGEADRDFENIFSEFGRSRLWWAVPGPPSAPAPGRRPRPTPWSRLCPTGNSRSPWSRPNCRRGSQPSRATSESAERECWARRSPRPRQR